MVHPILANYNLVLSKEAEKYLKALDKNTSIRIFSKIKKLSFENLSSDIKKIKGSKYNLYRLRCGNYRIFYRIKHKEIIIYIVTIGHRKEIYKRIKDKQ